MEHFERAVSTADTHVKFYTEKLESELRWLESNIAELRKEAERGTIYEQRNLVAKAADVADVAAKLRAAHEQVALLKSLKEEQ